MQAQTVQHAIQAFSHTDLKTAALDFFKALGYSSKKMRNVNLTNFLPDLDNKKALVEKEWQSSYFLFQLTDKDLQVNSDLFNSTNEAIIKSDTLIESYFFAAIELKASVYSRSSLVEITRLINKASTQPVLLLFKHGNSLTFSVIHRRVNKTDNDKDVLEKVTLLKDIRIENTHRAHLDILTEFSFNNLLSQPKNFVELHYAWHKVLNINLLNKNFYTELALIFNQLVGGKRKIGNKTIEAIGTLKLPSTIDDSIRKEFAVRLIGRLLFCWFLKKKELIPHKLLSLNAINTLQDYSYYHSILEPLFFEVLNKPIECDKHAEKRLSEYKQGLWQQIPFLNGGLFSPHLYDFYQLDDGHSVHLNTLVVSDEWLKTILTLFENYHFTIEENTSIDVEISIEPEMLGQIFENLLAEINDETGEAARKLTGSFYTPREIVDYMVDESLTQYLHEKTGLDSVKLATLLSYYADIKALDFSLADNKKIITAIENLKVLDPACGSGAFPIGVLQKLVLVLRYIDPSAELWLDNILVKIHDPQVQQLMRQKLTGDTDLLDYTRKLGIIRDCIYGADIQPLAAEITKLRCFLSLIVDEKIDSSKDNHGIIPLPSLEFKFMCANSLISLFPKNNDLFECTESIDQLKELRNEYLTAYGERKQAIKNEFKEIQYKMSGNFAGNDTVKLSTWRPFDNVPCSWFEADLMFGVNNGFDIVIGNPPYLRVQGLSKENKKDYAIFNSATGSYDLYVLFNEKGLSLLNEKGILNFIQPDKWINSSFGKGLRKVTAKNVTKLISFKQYQVFNASTYSSLLWLKKQTQQQLLYTELNRDLPNNTDLQLWLSELSSASFNGIANNKLSEDGWDFTVSENNLVMQRLQEHKQTLGDITRKIFQGIATSADKIYVLKVIQDNGDTLRCYSKQLDREIDIEKGLTRPFLMGKNVHRYELPIPVNAVIFPYKTKNDKAILLTQKEIKSNFPLGWDYLIENKKELESREHRKFADTWWCFSRPQNMTDFLAVKLMTPDICGKPELTIDESGVLYHTTTLYSFVFNEKAKGSAKYYLGLLNSKVMWHFQTVTGNVLRGGFLRFKTEYLKPFPIPPANTDQQKAIETLVDKILIGKKTGENTAHLEREIDQQVYALYGLTDDEINIIEGGK